MEANIWKAIKLFDIYEGTQIKEGYQIYGLFCQHSVQKTRPWKKQRSLAADEEDPAMDWKAMGIELRQ